MLTPTEVELLKLKIEIRELVSTLLDLSNNMDELEEVKDYLKELI